MKALICNEWGPLDALRVTEMPDPVPRAGEALVAIRAAGVNFPDTLIVAGKYQVKPALPFSPGAEIAGVVEAVGEHVTNVKPGDAVCGMCTYGGFATKIAMDARRLVSLPGGTDLVTAAAFQLTYATSYHAIFERAATKPGETLLVLGAAGGVGLAAVELGKIGGLKVIAAASNAGKLETCKRYGADLTIDYEAEDLREAVKRLTGGRGVDLVYDAVGVRFAEPAFRSLAWRGRYLVVGFAAGDIPRIPANLALLKEASIVGVYWGGFVQNDPAGAAKSMATLVQWLHDGKIKPLVSARYKLDDAVEALRAIAERRAQGKIVVEPV